MAVQGESRIEPLRSAVEANEKRRGKTRSAAFGILVAVIVSGLLWVIAYGAYLLLR